jgi:hypothetical protein
MISQSLSSLRAVFESYRASLYAYLYLLLMNEDYPLLIGSLGLFVVPKGVEHKPFAARSEAAAHRAAGRPEHRARRRRAHGRERHLDLKPAGRDVG